MNGGVATIAGRGRIRKKLVVMVVMVIILRPHTLEKQVTKSIRRDCGNP